MFRIFSRTKKSSIELKALVQQNGISLSLQDDTRPLPWVDLPTHSPMRFIFEAVGKFENGLPTRDNTSLKLPEIISENTAWIPIDFYWETHEQQIIGGDEEEGNELEEYLNRFTGYLRESISSDDLPRFNPYRILLKNKGAFGQRSIEFIWMVIDHAGEEYYARVEENGLVVAWDDSDGTNRYLLSRNEYTLVKHIDKTNAVLSSLSKSQQLSQWAELREIMTQFEECDEDWKILVSQYLREEKPIRATSVSASPTLESDGTLKISPVLTGDAAVVNEKLNYPIPADGMISSRSEEGDYVRVLPTEESQELIQQINRKSVIPPEEVPQFILDAEPIFGEQFDYVEFSRRVREIGIFVYRSQPFVEGKTDGKEWWEWEFTLDLDPLLEGENLGERLDLLQDPIVVEDLISRVEEAKEKGVDFIQLPSSDQENPSVNYINVAPHNVTLQLLKAKKKQFEAIEDEEKRKEAPDLTLLIHENLDELDYSEGDRADIIPDRYLVETALPLALKPDFQLKSYQKAGYYWLMGLERDAERKGGLLADDMGLGKTFQIITFLARLKETQRLSPSLIVFPKALLTNWNSEIQKFLTPGYLQTYIYYEGNFDIETVGNSDITLTTYETLRRKQLELGRIKFKAIVLDEAQGIKNSYTRVAHAVKAMNADIKVACTGTPVENTLLDLWSLFDFFKPGFLSSMKHFKANFVSPLGSEKSTVEDRIQLSKQLRSTIRPFYIRRMKVDYLDELPPIHHRAYPVELSEQQKKYYRALLRLRHHPGMALAALQKLLMVSAHPSLIQQTQDDPIDTCPKLRKTLEILDMIYEKQEKAIIFAGYLQLQDLLGEIIENRFNLRLPSAINGKASSGVRLKAIDDFEATPGFNVLIISPKAGGVGLNITAANHVICYTRPWNPAVENQAIDRAYRIGQERTVTVHYPVASSMDPEVPSVEDKLDKLLNLKKELLADFIRPTSELTIRPEDFASCFKKDDSEAEKLTLEEFKAGLSQLEEEALSALLLESAGYAVHLGIPGQGPGEGMLIQKRGGDGFLFCRISHRDQSSPMEEISSQAKQLFPDRCGLAIAALNPAGLDFLPERTEIFDWDTLNTWWNKNSLDYEEVTRRNESRKAWWIQTND